MTYYATVHKGEDHQALLGQQLDPCTSHMVFDTGYDLAMMREWVAAKPYLVIWEMEKDTEAKFGYRFKALVGVPQ